MQRLFFCIWFLSLNATFLIFIHVVCWFLFSLLFFIVAEYSISMLKSVYLFSCKKCLDRFYFSPVINKTALSILITHFWGHVLSFLSHKSLRTEWLVPGICEPLTCIFNCLKSSRNDCVILHPPPNVYKIWLLYILITIWSSQCFCFTHYRGCGLIPLWFEIIFLRWQIYFEHLLAFFVFFSEIDVYISCPLLLDCDLFILICGHHLYILDISSLCSKLFFSIQWLTF